MVNVSKSSRKNDIKIVESETEMPKESIHSQKK